MKSSCGLVGFELMQKLKQILQLTVEFENHELLFKAVDQMERHSFDLEDAYNFSYAQMVGVSEFETFDQKLLKKFGK